MHFILTVFFMLLSPYRQREATYFLTKKFKYNISLYDKNNVATDE